MLTVVPANGGVKLAILRELREVDTLRLGVSKRDAYSRVYTYIFLEGVTFLPLLTHREPGEATHSSSASRRALRIRAREDERGVSELGAWRKTGEGSAAGKRGECRPGEGAFGSEGWLRAGEVSC